VAVVNAAGELTHRFGSPELCTLTRSSIKPFQALALELSGAARAFALTSAEIAIACASHSGTDEHVAVVAGLLAKAGATAADLQCGAHLPIGMRLLERPSLAGEDRDPLRNNCSGKHAGFLLLARHLNAPFATYLERDGVVQRVVRAGIGQALALDAEALAWGTDGCSAPNYAIPLLALARGMARLAFPESAPSNVRSALELVRDSMWQHPRLVAGEQRFDYDLMRALPNNAVSKGGAEAMQLFALREPALACAIKIHDGAERGLSPLSVATLRQLGVFAKTPSELERHAGLEIRNHRKLVTGHVVVNLELERLRA
jgi:L-asparaginase II